MTWTRERPKVSGWYWMRQCCDEDTMVVRVEVLGAHVEWKQNYGDDWTIVDSDDCQEWSSESITLPTEAG